MTKLTTASIDFHKIAFVGLCLTVLSLIILYIYFLSASVIHVVIRKEINQDLVALRTEISDLETEYIDAQHRVSDEIARLDGYREVTSKVFIDRTPSSLVLSDRVQ